MYQVLYKRVLNKHKFNSQYPGQAIIEKEKNLSLRNSRHYAIWSLLIYALYDSQWGQLTTGLKPLWYHALSLIALFFIQDFYFYLAHYLMHLKKAHWVGHHIHHQFKNPTPWSALAMSRTEFHVQTLFYFLVCFILPLHPIVLLTYSTIAFFINTIGHSGFELWKPKLSFIGSSITHYRHHRFYHCNLALYFPFWDKLFCTAYPYKVSSHRLETDDKKGR
jgi:sterol desaturase/sphingolipid hydroxylase (fatty acid hydroxylase superfamily)